MDNLSYQITGHLTIATKPRLDDTCPWSEELTNELLYDVAAQLSEEQEGLMNTSELPETLHTPFEYKQTVKKFK